MPLNKPAELRELEQILSAGYVGLRVEEVTRALVPGGEYPVYALTVGAAGLDVPVAGFFGGVHGLERVGARVVLAFLRSLLERLRWDRALQQQLEQLRLVFMPVVNPGGLWQNTRSNCRGVDLMRNAPVDASERVSMLLGGQRFSRYVAWYRGKAGEPMEPEAQALCDIVARELLPAPFSLAVDCHSGFGSRDRLWFPYAHTREPIDHLAEVYAFKMLFDAAYPHHDYIFEPQSLQYLTHGDLWDHLYMQSLTGAGGVFLPFTLELGSWRWVRKRPIQLFSRHGMFNPLTHHRHQRVMRRHLVLLDFITRAAGSGESWLPQGDLRQHHHRAAVDRWYLESTL